MAVWYQHFELPFSQRWELHLWEFTSGSRGSSAVLVLEPSNATRNLTLPGAVEQVFILQIECSHLKLETKPIATSFLEHLKKAFTSLSCRLHHR